jgi:hypothetical protein
MAKLVHEVLAEFTAIPEMLTLRAIQYGGCLPYMAIKYMICTSCGLEIDLMF